MTCTMDSYLGGYLLDALESDETRAVQEHLADCPACRDELDSLAWTVSLLALIPPDMVQEFLDDDRPAAGVGQQPEQPRRFRAPLFLIAALLAVLAAVGGPELPGGSSPGAPVPVQAADPITHVRASVTMTGRPWGTELQMNLTGAYPSGWCSLVARSADGGRESAATWVADSLGTAEVDGTTAIPLDRLAGLDVVTATGDVLVRIDLPGHGQ